MKKNVILNLSLEEYKKKYHNRREYLPVVSKKEVEDFDKNHNKGIKEKNYLLKDNKWALINDKYYQIPKAPRYTWFKNLKKSVRVTTCALVAGGVTSAVIFPILSVTIWKPINVEVKEEVKQYVDIDVGKAEIGQPLTTEFTLKESAKEIKQLPKNLKIVKTGDVILNEWHKTTITKSIKNDDTEPENYYTYSLISKEKAELYIKKVLGPISVEMEVENRSYAVTFNPNNEVDVSTSIEVEKGKKISKDQIKKIEDNDFRTFSGWYLEGKDTKFDFDHQVITKPITLTAKYEKTNKSGVYIKGLKGIAQSERYFDNLTEAYNKGHDIVYSLSNIDEETFLNTFDDYTIIEHEGKKRYLANISWYVFGDVAVDVDNYYFLSFGRHNKKLGENFDIYNTNLIGVTKGAKLSTPIRFCIIEGSSTDSLENPFNIKNLELNLTNDFVLTCQDAGSHFVLNVDNCKFDNTLYIDQDYKMSITIENSTFEFESNYSYAAQIIRSDYESVGSKVKEDSIIFRNNIFNGEKYNKCINLNDPYCNNGIIENNTFKNVHTNGEGKPGNGVVQFSQGVKYQVNNNTFDNCQCNVFLIHEDFLEYCDELNLTINNNTIKNCKYVGVNETGRSDFYHLVSSGNKITGTSIDTCAKDYTECTKGSENEKYIFYINRSVN